jgi:hypothetical protein
VSEWEQLAQLNELLPIRQMLPARYPGQEFKFGDHRNRRAIFYQQVRKSCLLTSPRQEID